MKKIYSFALAAVAILSAASCQKEMANEAIVDNGGDAFKVTAISATDSKTVLDGVNTYWTPGDQIALYNENGAEVTFTTDITETAAKAVFTAESAFVPHADGLLAVYPKRTDRDATSYADGVVTGLHIGGTQQAVAGSFDPKFAVALGVALPEESNDLLFVNIHSLVKFTVGGETAPATVTLKNNGERKIAGTYNVEISEGQATVTEGADEITLNGPFEVGKTYYIALVYGECENGISLYFDDVEVKNTGETITLEPNKIYNLGTLSTAAEPEEPEVTKEVIWANDGSVPAAIWSASPYRFAVNGADALNECVAEIPVKTWEKMKTTPFYVTIKPAADWFQVRILDGWWSVGNTDANDITPNYPGLVPGADGTYTFMVDLAANPDLVAVIDVRHLLFAGDEFSIVEIYFPAAEGDDEGDDQPEPVVAWENDGTVGACNWDSSYRFALSGHDSLNECAAEFSYAVWDRLKTAPFDLLIQPAADWWQIRVTDGWWSVNDESGASDINPQSSGVVANADGTFTVTVDISANDPLLAVIDAQHLLFTGGGYQILKITCK